MTTNSPGKFFLGCAVWAYRDWIGAFYPSGSQPRDFLRLYGERLTAVEGNTTFYSVPGPEMIERWSQEMPAKFQFCPKLPRDITHAGALEPLIPQALDFIERMAPLGDRLGPIFAQLPPWYGPDKRADLKIFLDAWPYQQIPLALEVRHRAWFNPGPFEILKPMLEQHHVGRVLLDTRAIYDGADDPQRDSQRKKPNLPLQPNRTAAFSLVRLITHPDPERNQAYLFEWAHRVARWLKEGTTVYFFIHCPEEVRSTGTARHFQKLLEQQGHAQNVEIPKLPWDTITPPPDQLSLF